jgi:hypothetical protein
MRYDEPEETVPTVSAEEETVRPWTTEIAVTVEEETTPLTDDELEPIYLINMSIGPEEMLKQPYGVWMEEFKAKEQAEADSAEEE